MLINTLNILTEISIGMLFFGITFSNSATEIFAIAIIVFFIIKRILSREFTPPKTPVNAILYTLCAIVFVTFLRSAYFSESIRGFIRIVKFIFLFFALSEFFSEDGKRIKRTFWIIMAVTCFTLLNGIFQSISGFDFLRHHEGMKVDNIVRILASFVHPNDFAGFIIFILPLSFCFFCPEFKKNQRFFLTVIFLLGAYCLLRTSSRSAWLGCSVGILVYLSICRKKMSLIIPLALILSIVFFPHEIGRIKNLFSFERNTVWERAQLWKGTWSMVKMHPVLGFGINTFSRYFPQYKPAEYWGIMYAHNSYLQMWSEIGILGLLSYLWLILTILIITLRNMRKKLKENFEGFILLGAISGYIAFLVQSGLDTNLYSLVLTTLFWFMTSYIVSINTVLEKEIASSPSAPRNDRCL